MLYSRPLKPADADWGLAQALDPARLPRHIAIIMDGNGRWARRRNLPRAAGHQAGVDSVRSMVETCGQLGIEILTLYAFSVENWKRPRTEVDMLWRLLRIYIRKELASLMKNGVRVCAIGRLDALPDRARRELIEAVETTTKNRGLLVNLAINYGGRTELADSMNLILQKARAGGTLECLRVDEEMISREPVHGGVAGPRPAHPHLGGNARQQFPVVADRLLGAVRHRHAVARFPPRRAAARHFELPVPRPAFRRSEWWRGHAPIQSRAAGSGGSRAMKRVLTAVILAPFIVWVVLWGPPYAFLAVLSTVALLCYHEYAGIVAGYGIEKPGPIGYAAGLILLLAQREPTLLVTLLALLALGMSMAAQDLRKCLPRAAAVFFGVVYVFGCWRTAIFLRGRSPHWLLFALAMNWVGDSAAYYVGRKLGRHKLAPRIARGNRGRGRSLRWLLRSGLRCCI